MRNNGSGLLVALLGSLAVRIVRTQSVPPPMGPSPAPGENLKFMGPYYFRSRIGKSAYGRGYPYAYTPQVTTYDFSYYPYAYESQYSGSAYYDPRYPLLQGNQLPYWNMEAVQSAPNLPVPGQPPNYGMKPRRFQPGETSSIAQRIQS